MLLHSLDMWHAVTYLCCSSMHVVAMLAAGTVFCTLQGPLRLLCAVHCACHFEEQGCRWQPVRATVLAWTCRPCPV